MHKPFFLSIGTTVYVLNLSCSSNSLTYKLGNTSDDLYQKSPKATSKRSCLQWQSDLIKDFTLTFEDDFVQLVYIDEALNGIGRQNTEGLMTTVCVSAFSYLVKVMPFYVGGFYPVTIPPKKKKLTKSHQFMDKTLVLSVGISAFAKTPLAIHIIVQRLASW